MSEGDGDEGRAECWGLSMMAASPSPLAAVGARGCLGCWWLLEDGGLLEDPVLVLEPLWSCSGIGTGSMAVVKPADHVQKGLEPPGSVERLTHPYVVATIFLCLGGGWGIPVTWSRVNGRKSDTGWWDCEPCSVLEGKAETQMMMTG